MGSRLRGNGIAFLRFAVAGVLLSPFLLRAKRIDWAAGAALGAVLFAAFMFQVEALALMSANRNAFITGLNVLVVPLLGVLAANEAALVYALEPACAAIAAYFWLAEVMTLRSAFGGALLIGGMIVSQWAPRPRATLAVAAQ